MTTPSTPYQQPQPQPPQQPQAPQQPFPSQGHVPHQPVPYASPIPARRAHLGDALASEWTKLRSVRSTMWSLGVMILLMVGIGLLAAAVVAATRNAVGGDVDATGENVLTLGFFGVLLSSLCVMTLGVLTMSSEYGTGMIRTTLTACPSRGRVLAAKALVFFAVVFTVSTLTTLVVAALQTTIIDATAPATSEWLRATVGVSLYLSLLGLLSMAVGALVKHSAGAITVMVGLVLVPLVLAMFMFSRSLSGVQEFLFAYSIPSQLIQFYGTAFSDGGPSGWTPLWIILGMTAIAMAGAYLSLDRRDA
ncbi:ABC transporter permease [Streptomyces sp. NPDC056987]|uniref:ABC transporter permease n=1 Tax=Streptomyces sp. NPDC056987 TaxID=3345988 RepID=UPI003640F68D